MLPRPLLYGFLLGGIGFAADLLVPMIFNLTSGNGHLISTFIMGPSGFVLGCLIGAVTRRKA